MKSQIDFQEKDGVSHCLPKHQQSSKLPSNAIKKQVISGQKSQIAYREGMERLTELVRVYDPDERVLGYDFKTASGQTYSHRDCQYSQDGAKRQVYCSMICPA